MNRNLLVILRSITAGYKTIFENKDGEYISKQVDHFQTHSMHEGMEEKDIESRLQFELYGEYPLSPGNEHDWLTNVRPAFKM